MSLPWWRCIPRSCFTLSLEDSFKPTSLNCYTLFSQENSSLFAHFLDVSLGFSWAFYFIHLFIVCIFLTPYLQKVIAKLKAGGDWQIPSHNVFMIQCFYDTIFFLDFIFIFNYVYVFETP